MVIRPEGETLGPPVKPNPDDKKIVKEEIIVAPVAPIAGPSRFVTPPGSPMAVDHPWKTTTAYDDHFLRSNVWDGLTQQHVAVAFDDKFGGGEMMGRKGLTTYPLKFDDDWKPTAIKIFYTDKHGRPRQEMVPFDNLSRAEPQKRGVNVMVLSGLHVGQVAQVQTVSRKKRTAKLQRSGEMWDEEFGVLCVVEEHKVMDCACSRG